MIPKDPAILLSYVNTQLRDYYSSLSELCYTLSTEENANVDSIKEKLITDLNKIDYEYDTKTNQFI